MQSTNNLKDTNNDNGSKRNSNRQLSYYWTYGRSDAIIPTGVMCTNLSKRHQTNTFWRNKKEDVVNFSLIETDKVGLQGIQYKILIQKKNAKFLIPQDNVDKTIPVITDTTATFHFWKWTLIK